MNNLDVALNEYNITDDEKRRLSNRINKSIKWYLEVNKPKSNNYNAMYQMKLDFVIKKIKCISNIQDLIDKKIHTRDLVKKDLENWSKELQDKRDELNLNFKETDEYGSDMYVCPRCKRRKQTIMQVQTRSLDEGATFKAKCICGHIWVVS